MFDEFKCSWEELLQQGIFFYIDDFFNFNEIVWDYFVIYELEVNVKEDIEWIFDCIVVNMYIVFLFLFLLDGNFEFIFYSFDNYECEEGVKIVYLGCKLEKFFIQEVMGK